MTNQSDKSDDAGYRLDRVPYGKFHKRLLTLIGAGMFLDGFELYIAGGVLASLVNTKFSTMAENAGFVTATFLGMVIGAWSAGILGDRYGRKFTFQINLLIFGLASVGAFFAPNINVLIGLRFIMGLGLGAEVVCSFAMLSEFVPSSVRGRMIGWLALLTNVPLLITGFLSVWVIPTLGWQYMFLFGGVGALIVWYARKGLPESPRWLQSKGRYREAEEILVRIEQEAGVTYKRGVSPTADVAAPKSVSVWALFSRPIRGRVLLGMFLHTVVNLCFYGFIGWLPTFLLKQGATITASLTWTTVMAIGAPVGALIGIGISDRLGRKPGIIGACLVAACFGGLLPYVGDGYILLFIGFCLFSAIYVLHAVGYALYVPELFPTEYRLRGMGLCSSTARLVTAAIQYGVVALFAFGGIAAIVGSLNVLLLLLALFVAMFGVETMRRPLEEIASDPGDSDVLVAPALSSQS
jgi:putative MFS transporter